jgi:hypothetical protein
MALKPLTLVILTSLIPFIAHAQNAGNRLIEGGGSGTFPLSASGETITYSMSLWAWSGQFLTAGFEIGPYASLGYTDTKVRSQETDTSTFTFNPGLQAGIAFTDEETMFMLRVTSAVQLQVDSVTSPASTTGDSSVAGIWVELDPELTVYIEGNAGITLGPALSVSYSLRDGGLGVTLVYNIAIRFRF